MPDVVIVGGGIIGACCADELARRGLSVALVERDELAAGASGRNAGLWIRPIDAALQAMAERSLDRYLEVAKISTLSIDLDAEAIGTVFVAIDGRDERASDVEAYRALGVAVEDLDSRRLRELEPALSPEIDHGWFVDDARRLDPAALTVSMAGLARESGAVVHHHLTVRGLINDGDRIRGVITDDGTIEAETVVVAAGPWSTSILETVGVRVPVTPVRGWLARLSARPDLLRHGVAEAGLRESLERADTIEPVPAAELSAGHRKGSIGIMLGPYPRGGLLIGTSRQAAVTPEPEDPSVPLRLARDSIRLVPELADAPVLGSWWGLRPMSPDERPIVGRVRDGVVVATGHGSEGVILGAGTAQLVAAIIEEEEPPFDPSPFDPFRFEIRTET